MQDTQPLNMSLPYIRLPRGDSAAYPCHYSKPALEFYIWLVLYNSYPRILCHVSIESGNDHDKHTFEDVLVTKFETARIA